MPTMLTRAPLGRSNWGTGVQPARGPRQIDLPPPAPGRSLGTLTQANARPMGNQLNPQYDESQDPVSPVAARPIAPVAPRTALTRAPAPAALPNTDGLSGFALTNTLANAGIYQPGTFGASNAAANGTGYQPPQQTERADPLSGDRGGGLLEGQSADIPRTPFVQRGSGVPQGQDMMNGGGILRRNTPKQPTMYSQYVRSMFPSSGY